VSDSQFIKPLLRVTNYQLSRKNVIGNRAKKTLFALVSYQATPGVCIERPSQVGSFAGWLSAENKTRQPTQSRWDNLSISTEILCLWKRNRIQNGDWPNKARSDNTAVLWYSDLKPAKEIFRRMKITMEAWTYLCGEVDVVGWRGVPLRAAAKQYCYRLRARGKLPGDSAVTAGPHRHLWSRFERCSNKPANWNIGTGADLTNNGVAFTRYHIEKSRTNNGYRIRSLGGHL
jgi:hypothetical protein